MLGALDARGPAYDRLKSGGIDGLRPEDAFGC